MRAGSPRARRAWRRRPGGWAELHGFPWNFAANLKNMAGAAGEPVKLADAQETPKLPRKQRHLRTTARRRQAHAERERERPLHGRSRRQLARQKLLGGCRRRAPHAGRAAAGGQVRRAQVSTTGEADRPRRPSAGAVAPATAGARRSIPPGSRRARRPGKDRAGGSRSRRPSGWRAPFGRCPATWKMSTSRRRRWRSERVDTPRTPAPVKGGVAGGANAPMIDAIRATDTGVPARASLGCPTAPAIGRRAPASSPNRAWRSAPAAHSGVARSAGSGRRRARFT